MTAAPAAELVLVQDQDAFSPPERPSGTKVVQVARPPKALERHRYPVLVSFYAGADYYFRAADQLRADCERIGIDYEIEELTLKHHEDWSRICRRKVEFIERKLKQLKRPILWVDVDTRINSIPSFLKDPSWDFAACLRGGSELDPVRLLSFARMWTPTVLVVNDTPMGHALVETMVKEARRHGGEATDDYFLEEAWRKLRSDLVALPIPPKFLDRNGSHPEAAFIYGPSGSVKTFKDSVDQHPNDKLGNLKAKIVSEISAKITDLQMRRNLLRTAWSREITDMDVMLKLAEQAKRVEPELAVEILLRAAGLHPRKYESRRMLVDLLLEQRDLKRARVIAEEIATSEYDDWRSLGRSRLADIELEERAAKAGFGLNERPAMWWAKRPYPGNFGDILNPYVIEKVTGRIPRYTPCGKGLMAIGSTIKFVEKGTHVWGTGCSRRGDPIDPHAIFHAVRGPLTRNVVRQSGGFCGDVYGDAALLLPMFFDPPVTKQHKLGYIPHYTHWDEPVETDAKRLDVRCVSYAEIEDFITQLKECEAVVSTSLHGIIVANAYGIPARWATFSASRNQVSGDGMKYEDYFLSVGMPVQTPLDLSAQPVLDSARMLEAMDRTVDLKINLQRLLNVCPTSLPA